MSIKNEFNEIYLVNEGGIPVYYYNSEKPKLAADDDDYIMQAGFLSAINQFGVSELGQDEVKYLVFNQKGYIYTKKSAFVLIFSKTGEDITEKLEELESTVKETATYLEEVLAELDFDKPVDTLGPNENKVLSKRFNKKLLESNIIIGETEFDAEGIQNQVKSAIFKSIGYKPGECNIGPVERQKRLVQGLEFLLLGFLGYIGILYFELPNLLILVLFFPFLMGFMGFFQYFFKFCVNNALQKRYQMR